MLTILNLFEALLVLLPIKKMFCFLCNAKDHCYIDNNSLLGTALSQINLPSHPTVLRQFLISKCTIFLSGFPIKTLYALLISHVIPIFRPSLNSSVIGITGAINDEQEIPA
jgi:hypothetical protein